MLVAKSRFQSAGQRLVGEQRVEVHRHLGHADAMPVGRDGGMQVSQGASIIEPAALGHEAVEQGQHAVGAVDEAAQKFPRVDAGLLAALVKPVSARAASSAGGSHRKVRK